MINPPKTIERQIEDSIETDIDAYMEAREDEGYKWGEQLEIFEENE